MKPVPLNAETEPIVRRLVWFEAPEEALADPVRFMAYAMARATHEDMKVIRRYVDDSDFLEALEKAPPGIIDRRSWAYWNSVPGGDLIRAIDDQHIHGHAAHLDELETELLLGGCEDIRRSFGWGVCAGAPRVVRRWRERRKSSRRRHRLREFQRELIGPGQTSLIHHAGLRAARRRSVRLIDVASQPQAEGGDGLSKNHP